MRILLIDDHPLFQQGFVSMMRSQRPGAHVTSAICCADACRTLAEDAAYDLALVDLQLPDTDGFTALRLIAEIAPLVPRAIISGREDQGARERARRAGASGFIAKSASPPLILAQVELLVAGETVWSDIDAGPALTPRQREILNLLCDGCANKEIRDRLGIAERTVRAHITGLFHRLGAQSRVQVVLRARAMGLSP